LPPIESVLAAMKKGDILLFLRNMFDGTKKARIK